MKVIDKIHLLGNDCTTCKFNDTQEHYICFNNHPIIQWVSYTPHKFFRYDTEEYATLKDKNQCSMLICEDYENN